MERTDKECADGSDDRDLSDDRLNFFSTAFEPLLALRTPGVTAPRQVPSLDNVAMCRRLVPGARPSATGTTATTSNAAAGAAQNLSWLEQRLSTLQLGPETARRAGFRDGPACRRDRWLDLQREYLQAGGGAGGADTAHGMRAAALVVRTRVEEDGRTRLLLVDFARKEPVLDSVEKIEPKKSDAAAGDAGGVDVHHNLWPFHESLRKHMSRRTVLVGDRLHVDLERLRVVHGRVVDVSLLFVPPVDLRPTQRPVLSTLVELVRLRRVSAGEDCSLTASQLLGRDDKPEPDKGAADLLNDSLALIDLVRAKLDEPDLALPWRAVAQDAGLGPGGRSGWDAAETSPLLGRYRRRNARYGQIVLNSIADSAKAGPLQVLHRLYQRRGRVWVQTRGAVAVRGSCSGWLLAFDKHLNMVLLDCVEEWQTQETRECEEVEDAGHGCTSTRIVLETVTVPHRRTVPQLFVKGDSVVFVREASS